MNDATSAQILAKFVAELSFLDIPSAVVERAKASIIDTVAAATFGAQFAWSKVGVDYARRYGSGGSCSIIGTPGILVHAPYAALANGIMAHAFELDGTRDPSVGAHVGATLVPTVLAACEDNNASGKTAITAFVAGCEVLVRIAAAAHHTGTPPESLGFHGPGLTSPYAAAAAAGHIFGLTQEQLGHALGIAGSLSSGILAFTKARQGGMVKRLHLGRAAESGILAARLASTGYTGPESVLDGKFGFLDVYCREGDSKWLTADLGRDWEMLRVGMKRYACHMNAQTPIQSTRELMAEHGFSGTDVASVLVEGIEKFVSHHNITQPGDVMQAQYSLPFCVALALFRDPDDPRSFDINTLNDPAIRAMCLKVELRGRAQPGRSNKATCVTIRLKDGREFKREEETFKGMPSNPLTRDELRQKFMLLSASTDEKIAGRLFERLESLETQERFTLQ